VQTVRLIITALIVGGAGHLIGFLEDFDSVAAMLISLLGVQIIDIFSDTFDEKRKTTPQSYKLNDH
jgi:hypothetical protein